MVHIQILGRLLASRVVVETALGAVAVDPEAAVSIIVMRPVGSIMEKLIQLSENLCSHDKARANSLRCRARCALLVAVC
jgi:hypothetical protein